MAEADPQQLHRASEDVRITEILETAHRMRSLLLDAFAKLESELYASALHFGIKPETSSPVGQRIAAFRSIAIKDAKQKTRLDGLLDELAEFCAIRAHVVHATIRPVLDIQEKVVLLQFQSVPIEKGLSFTLPLEDMKPMLHRVAGLANRFKQFRSQPSPPKPAASN